MKLLDMSKKLYNASNRIRRLYAIAYYYSAVVGRTRNTVCDEAVKFAEGAIYWPASIADFQIYRRDHFLMLGGVFDPYLLELADLCLSPEAIYTRQLGTAISLRDFYGAVGLDQGVLACFDLGGNRRSSQLAGVTETMIVGAMAVLKGDWQEALILADLVEEVGLSSEMSDHLRSHGKHPDGCWVIDSILGRT